MSKSSRPYPEAFRQQMVELCKAGRTPVELSKEFGCSVDSIKAWVKRGESSGADGPLSVSERQELMELRRKLRQVQMERDILAKATAWFAGKSEKTPGSSTNS